MAQLELKFVEMFRTHVIKVVGVVVKITIQLTYGIHGFKKKPEEAYNYKII